METAAKRPWYRLHWGTVFVFLLVGFIWTSFLFPAHYVVLPLNTPLQPAGWPFCMLDNAVQWGVSPRYNLGFLLFDVAIILACLSAIALILERLERSSRGLRRLSTLVAVVVVFWALYAFWQWDSQQMPFSTNIFFPDGAGFYMPLRDENFDVQFIVYFSLGCLAFVTIKGMLVVLLWPLSRLRRHGPATVEADGSPAQ